MMPIIFLLPFVFGKMNIETKYEHTNNEDILTDFMVQKSQKSEKKIRPLAKLLIKNSKRWNLNPGLVACVVWRESSYRWRPRKIKRCKTKIEGNKAVKVCRILNAPEVGIMQILPHDTSTKRGWRLCTGKKRLWRTRSQLRKPKVNVCIGTYELSKWKEWAHKKGKWWRPVLSWHRRFYRKNPKLKRYHWVASYNWGPRRIPRFSFKRRYPVNVLKCFKNYRNYKKRYNSLKNTAFLIQ